ncbi:unnamed protein product [Sphenostylis stenocarpa]|uniref:Uncharacterized protein n=1 Tax=Sphenostylis stenocarpa TaxID=92480 RepID=A0AA86VZ23_9FABA|nr:unnamed protein product [Sphenostylis stenocarpa]
MHRVEEAQHKNERVLKNRQSCGLTAHANGSAKHLNVFQDAQNRKFSTVRKTEKNGEMTYQSPNGDGRRRRGSNAQECGGADKGYKENEFE